MVCFPLCAPNNHPTSPFVLVLEANDWGKSIALFVATGLLFTRTVFRSVELSEGFAGELANKEPEFMVLDGVMIILACLCLTIFHPGVGFGKRWNDATFPFRISKKAKADAEAARIAGDDSEKVGTDTSG